MIAATTVPAAQRAERFRPNQFRHATTIATPAAYRDGRWETFEPKPAVDRTLLGRVFRLRPGLTFTPYANPTPCNAHCSFCSEELLRIDADRLTAKRTITDYDQYFAALDRAWRELDGFTMGLSLSGLEATSEPEWLLRLLALLDEHPQLFAERVLYTNGSGLATDARLVPALARARFDRVELSRAHFDERRNHRIMRFDLAQPIRRRAVFEQTVRALRAQATDVRLVCILNDEGVSTIEGVEEYIAEARALGVDRVVFRELSVLGEIYLENRETKWIDRHRAPVRALMERVLPSADAPCEVENVCREGWALEGVTAGYYYYNEVYRRDGVEVVLEGSSYVAHRDAVESGVLQKLVFHSTMELCGDWVPNAQVIGRYG
ncbi:MAG: radical SAM protein [Myxococcales bacterium]|nr:radical SAM protein [Myxococcales bacterium]